jgi:hypothetical protein
VSIAFHPFAQLALGQILGAFVQVRGLPFFVIPSVGFVIGIVICILLYNAQAALPPQFQRIPAAQIWLLLIPVFHLVWNFFVYPRVSESYRMYFNSQGRIDVGDAGQGVGLAFSICAIFVYMPCINLCAAPATLILLIIYLVKIYDLKSQIGSPGGGFPITPNQPPPPPQA